MSENINELNYLSNQCSTIIAECQKAISRKHNLKLVYQIASIILCFIGTAAMPIPFVPSLCFLFTIWLMLAVNYASKSESDYRVSMIEFSYIRKEAEYLVGRPDLRSNDVQHLRDSYSRLEAYHLSFVKSNW